MVHQALLISKAQNRDDLAFLSRYLLLYLQHRLLPFLGFDRLIAHIFRELNLSQSKLHPHQHRRDPFPLNWKSYQ